MQDKYSVKEIDFVVPDFETARRIFEHAMGLRVKHCGDTNISFELNPYTNLICWLPKFGTGLWGRRIRINASDEDIVNTAYLLINGIDRVDLRVIKRGDMHFQLLQITIPIVMTTVVISGENG